MYEFPFGLRKKSISRVKNAIFGRKSRFLGPCGPAPPYPTYFRGCALDVLARRAAAQNGANGVIHVRPPVGARELCASRADAAVSECATGVYGEREHFAPGRRNDDGERAV